MGAAPTSLVYVYWCWYRALIHPLKQCIFPTRIHNHIRSLAWMDLCQVDRWTGSLFKAWSPFQPLTNEFTGRALQNRHLKAHDHTVSLIWLCKWKTSSRGVCVGLCLEWKWLLSIKHGNTDIFWLYSKSLLPRKQLENQKITKWSFRLLTKVVFYQLNNPNSTFCRNSYKCLSG